MIFGFERLDLDRDGAGWPHRARSRIVRAAGLRWHVQEWNGPEPSAGEGGTSPEKVLLIHGTGAATHSWAGLAPILATRFQVASMDLPGHGFTATPPAYRLSVPGMVAALADLGDALAFSPDLVVAHSAGAAIAIALRDQKKIAPRLIVSLNGALKPFPGMAGQIFPAMAKLLFLNPLTPRAFAWSARDPARVASLIEGTGSVLDPADQALYGRLFQNPGHVAGALGMMANWDLIPVRDALARLDTPIVLAAAENDKTIAPSVAADAAAAAPHGRVVSLSGLGHLAHEEDPARIAAMIFEAADAPAAS